jgi:hypothetical protein
MVRISDVDCNIVGPIHNAIEPNSSLHIVFTIQGRKNSKEIPLAEVKIDSSELATKIRKQLVAKKECWSGFGLSIQYQQSRLINHSKTGRVCPVTIPHPDTKWPFEYRTSPVLLVQIWILNYVI